MDGVKTHGKNARTWFMGFYKFLDKDNLNFTQQLDMIEEDVNHELCYSITN